jgi:iron complex transport system permease protein
MVVIPTVAIGLIPLFLLRWRIAVLSLGDDDARALGVDARRTRLVVISAATLITASVVAVSGVIGWVGLMVPHLARLLVGPRFDRLLPVSILLGASFMVVVDTLARTVARIEIPIGVLTALVGGGLFVWLITRHGSRALWRRE